MIKPTVGRIVWFYESVTSSEPHAAIVCRVWCDRMVNLMVIDFDGQSHSVTSVDLLQDDEQPTGQSRWCAWMPYQKAVAKGEIAPTLHADSKG